MLPIIGQNCSVGNSIFPIAARTNVPMTPMMRAEPMMKMTTFAASVVSGHL